MNKNLILLELMNCAITPLGCEFLTKALDPSVGPSLQVLKLDYNPEIGDSGIAILAECLRKNKVLTMVSLAYCGITALGAESLFTVLIYQCSQIELINLSGNQFKNEGIMPIFRGLAAAKSLVKAQLCDCGWEDCEEVVQAMKISFT